VCLAAGLLPHVHVCVCSWPSIWLKHASMIDMLLLDVLGMKYVILDIELNEMSWIGWHIWHCGHHICWSCM
jgi:hypothetical protein